MDCEGRSSMSTILVVFYSHTGTGRRLARALCMQQDWPIGEVTDRHPRIGMWGSLRCVLDSLFHRRPAIDYHGPRPDGVGTVVLVAPIWAGRLAGPMRSFVASRHDTLPRVALISVMGGHGASDAAGEVGRLLCRDPPMHAAVTTLEVNQGTALARLRAFTDALKAAPPPRARWEPGVHHVS